MENNNTKLGKCGIWQSNNEMKKNLRTKHQDILKNGEAGSNRSFACMERYFDLCSDLEAHEKECNRCSTFEK